MTDPKKVCGAQEWNPRDNMQGERLSLPRAGKRERFEGTAKRIEFVIRRRIVGTIALRRSRRESDEHVICGKRKRASACSTLHTPPMFRCVEQNARHEDCCEPAQVINTAGLIALPEEANDGLGDEARGTRLA